MRFRRLFFILKDDRSSERIKAELRTERVLLTTLAIIAFGLIQGTLNFPSLSWCDTSTGEYKLTENAQEIQALQGKPIIPDDYCKETRIESYERVITLSFWIFDFHYRTDAIYTFFITAVIASYIYIFIRQCINIRDL